MRQVISLGSGAIGSIGWTRLWGALRCHLDRHNFKGSLGVSMECLQDVSVLERASSQEEDIMID